MRFELTWTSTKGCKAMSKIKFYIRITKKMSGWITHEAVSEKACREYAESNGWTVYDLRSTKPAYAEMYPVLSTESLTDGEQK